MSRRPSSTSTRFAWLPWCIALLVATGAALVLVQLLMAPPAAELRSTAVALGLTGAATTVLLWFALQLADRYTSLSLRARLLLSAVAGSALALLNVLVLAKLMFVSTDHDLPLLAAFLAFGAIVTAFFSVWTASAVTERLRMLAGAIGRMAAGDYTVSVAVQGRDEVARLTSDVNELASRLEESARQQAAVEHERRELTASISHDLRTPLASIRAMIEALEDKVVTEETEVSRYYEKMRREIERLSRMIQDLFDLAQLDAGAFKLERRELALQDIAAEVVDAMQARALHRNVSLRLDVVGDPPPLLLDGGRMERAIGNLLENALVHTPAGGCVDVIISARNGSVELTVKDTGEGIEATDLSGIWERFYRAEKSRRRDLDGSDGAGLGLAIVRGFVEAHGGAIEAQSAPGKGATFIVRVPNGRNAVSLTH